MPRPLPVIANTWRIALNWSESVTGQTATNVVHLTTDVAGGAPSDIFELLDDCVAAGMWETMVTAASVVDVGITPLDGSGATGHFSPAGAAWAGVSANDFAPQLAHIVKLGTALRGRSKRGRIFLPFVSEAANTKGHLSPGDSATMTAAWTAFNAALIADATTPSRLVVASYKLATEQAVTTFQAEVVAGTQRRRMERLR